MSSTWLSENLWSDPSFKTHEIHHTMTAAGGSDHHRSMAVVAHGVHGRHQFCGGNAPYAGQQLTAANDDGQDIVDINAGEQAEKIHGPGSSGMGAYVGRLGAVVRADEIGMADKGLAGCSPHGMRHSGQPGVLD